MAKNGPRAGGRRTGLGRLTLRQIHLYIGVFIAPSLLFFAFTGAMQLFSLHEVHGAYQPPALIETLGKIHKDQVLTTKAAPDADADHHPPDHHHADAEPKPTTLALKVFFLVVAAGLIVSTTFGLWMALLQSRSRTIAWMLFLAGAVIPIALLLA